MAVYNYDVVVLGSGPAGEGAAMNAAKAGRKVAMVDSPRQVVVRRAQRGACGRVGMLTAREVRKTAELADVRARLRKLKERALLIHLCLRNGTAAGRRRLGGSRAIRVSRLRRAARAGAKLLRAEVEREAIAGRPSRVRPLGAETGGR